MIRVKSWGTAGSREASVSIEEEGAGMMYRIYYKRAVSKAPREVEDLFSAGSVNKLVFVVCLVVSRRGAGLTRCARPTVAVNDLWQHSHLRMWQ